MAVTRISESRRSHVSHHDLTEALGSDFDVGRCGNIADALRDHFTSSVRDQLAFASEQRGLVPRAADFERLFLIASFRGTKDALARVQAWTIALA